MVSGIGIAPVGEPEDAADRGREAPLRCLAPAVVRLWRLAWLGWTLALAAAAALLGRVVDEPLAAMAGTVIVVALGLLGALVWPGLRFRSWQYGVRETDLFVRHGVVSRVTSIVPHARIQHVDTRQGLVERRLGLARVVVFTAGIRGAELTLPGLAATDADALRDRLAALSGGATTDAV